VDLFSAAGNLFRLALKYSISAPNRPGVTVNFLSPTVYHFNPTLNLFDATLYRFETLAGPVRAEMLRVVDK
jgi:hypothetical protein